jgi:hypothetical protein
MMQAECHHHCAPHLKLGEVVKLRSFSTAAVHESQNYPSDSMSRRVANTVNFRRMSLVCHLFLRTVSSVPGVARWPWQYVTGPVGRESRDRLIIQKWGNAYVLLPPCLWQVSLAGNFLKSIIYKLHQNNMHVQAPIATSSILYRSRSRRK